MIMPIFTDILMGIVVLGFLEMFATILWFIKELIKEDRDDNL